ncbi:hypothetical protein SLEP1_g47342 [Rubroshorea leprosula]|uniref:Suppressor of white apricot N-terminal domain-containing protein n=1 Tax=Rubroshorea leprosula TaxID=152421 RepID=A0AAV5LQ78_9ROSI|nr:hypothetical protein SLEP1_g47342 [Rubroshorea leprosula]
MDLEVVGRHALLFDDDAMASFVNSPEALVEWNSLFIDRYDVRHLLSSPPPPRKKRCYPSSPVLNPDGHLESELDVERYQDLPPPSASPSGTQDGENGEEPMNAGGYNAVPFSYGDAGESTEQKDADADSDFRPPFPVPESLLQNLMLGAEMEFLFPFDVITRGHAGGIRMIEIRYFSLILMTEN